MSQKDEAQHRVGASALFEAFGPPSTGMESRPEMRSVMRVSASPGVQLAAPSFGLAKPSPLGIARPSKLSARSSSSGKSLEVKQTWTGVTTAEVWNVKGEELEMVPVDFPLERTHRTIEDADASSVAKRISDALRTHSIEAKFGSNPVKAKCKTNDCVSFRIRLYAGGENGLPVVVEIQRRSGSASSFMKSCRAILAAAEGKQEVPQLAKKMPPFKMPVGSMKCLEQLPKMSDPVADAQMAIAGAAEMIRSSKRDTNVLGLENLWTMTDPLKTAPRVALEVSKCVVLGDEKHDIRDDVRVLTERDGFDESDDEPMLMNHNEKLRHLAMSIFANGISLCAKDGCLAGAIDEQAWFKEHLMPHLVDEVKLCESDSLTALQAARCISSLLQCSETARRFLNSCGVFAALEKANEFGKVRNDMLAEESARCLQLLE